jgi:hypothetical protein
VEYYGECPKRFKEAYAKQSRRSRAYLPDHFNLVETLLVNCPHSLIHRLHMKADNNATADNAHVITDIEADTCHVLLGVLPEQLALDGFARAVVRGPTAGGYGAQSLQLSRRVQDHGPRIMGHVLWRLAL